MRLLTLLATAALLTGPAVLSVPHAALAQTSFSGQAQVTDRASWEVATDRAVSSGLSRVDSALAVYGNAASISLDVALIINPDGSIAEVVVQRSSGRPSIDDAVVRALSRDMGIPPFSSDMPPSPVTMTLALGTTRG